MTPVNVLVTQRLTLVPWRHTYLDELRRLAGDERIVRFVGDRRPWSAALTLARHELALDHWTRHGFGWRAALDTATSGFVGLGALTHRAPDESGIGAAAIELGWWVAPAAWGCGLATEIAHAIRDEAFLHHKAESVITRHQDGNAASARIIAKLGLVRHHSLDGPGQAPYLTHLHTLDRATFLRKAGGDPLPPRLRSQGALGDRGGLQGLPPQGPRGPQEHRTPYLGTTRDHTLEA